LKKEADKKTADIGKGKAGPGRPKGAQNKVSAAARSVIGDQGREVVQGLIDAALNGDTNAGRALLPFILPRAERSITVDIGNLISPQDVIAAYRRLGAQMKAGEIAEPDLAAADRVLTGWVRAYEVNNLGERLSQVEAQLAKNQSGK
jgi:hypothetical protein